MEDEEEENSILIHILYIRILIICLWKGLKKKKDKVHIEDLRREMEQDKVVHEMEGEQVSSAIIDALQYKNNNPNNPNNTNNPSPVTQPQPQQQEEVEAGKNRLKGSWNWFLSNTNNNIIWLINTIHSLLIIILDFD